MNEVAVFILAAVLLLLVIVVFGRKSGDDYINIDERTFNERKKNESLKK